MAGALNSSLGAQGGIGADLYLYVKCKKAGVVIGESQSPGHKDEIILTGWNWGVSASSALGHTQATSRRSYTGLTVRKLIDSATTPLMNALIHNDEVVEARLATRRAGGEQEDYFVITLKHARVSSVQHDVNANGDAMESVTFMFTRVECEYRAQANTGLRSGSKTFQDDIAPNGGAS